jgi:hypothetical protein
VTHKTRFLLLTLLIFALAPMAVADIIQDLTADIVCYPCNFHSAFLTMSPHSGPMPARGWADYKFLGQPWTFSFLTATPISWVDNGPFTFSLQFGQGGTFNMTGPHGLTFAGVVESGNSVNFGLGLEQIAIDFSGQWSNGWQAAGTVFERYNAGWPHVPVGEWSELHTHPTSGSSTPEPSSVVLLGSALLAAWRYRARYFG